MVALVDYGAGNLTSVRKGAAAAGLDLQTARSPEDLVRAIGIIIPGVGHFSATASLDRRWRGAIMDCVGRGAPVLGICLGMQWLFEGSEECPDLPGLGLFAGVCTRIDAKRPLKVPHVGWSRLTLRWNSVVLAKVDEGVHVYFTHGFAAPVTAECAATACHGQIFAAAVEKDHVWGVQFHPEKSADAGLQVLRNFACRVRA